LANTLNDITGKTGLAIIRAIVKGERNPWKLAALRDGRVQATEDEIAHSLAGNWRPDVLFELKQVLATYNSLQQQIFRLRPAAGEGDAVSADEVVPGGSGSAHELCRAS
jgi:hypothetical protein